MGLLTAAAADVGISEAAKRKRWVRVLSALGTLAGVALVAALVYVTFAYS